MSGNKEYRPYVADKLLDDARVLINFATRQGVEISEDIFSVIIAAQEAVSNKSYTAGDEIKLLLAFNELTRQIQPVDLDSIKAAYEPVTIKPNLLHKVLRIADMSRAEMIMLFFRSLTIISLGLLLLVQITWLYGNIIITEVTIVSKNTIKAREERLNLTPTSPEIRNRINILDAELQDYSYKYKASQIALENWLRIISFGRNGTSVMASNRGDQVLQPLIYVQKSQYLLKVLELYILPLLYGIVGACAYILRSLSQEIKALTYAGDSNAVYFTRLLLGGLSGLAIGWFVEPDTSSALIKFSPFAIAFVAGYSVELLFALMDKIIFSFIPSGSTK